jgi:hypothetical protein
VTEMRYLALRDFAMHLERIKMRADAGGHSAPESVLRPIHAASIRNVSRAIREMDFLTCMTTDGASHRACCCYLAEDIPGWLAAALEQLWSWQLLGASPRIGGASVILSRRARLGGHLFFNRITTVSITHLNQPLGVSVERRADSPSY